MSIENLFWHGRVVSRKEWESNRPNVPFESPSSVSGRGYRVPVRIYSKHPKSKAVLPDSDLEFIEVLGSTSGSGIGGNGDTPGITQGDEVFGIYRDENGGDPIIIGTRLPNANVKLNLTENDDGFSNLSGFNQTDKVPRFLIPSIKSYLLENTRVANPNQISLSDIIKQYEESISLQSPCDSTNIDSIQSDIQKLIQKIEKVKRLSKSWIYTISNPIRYNNQNLSPDEYILQLINKTSKTISKYLKNVINDIRQYVIDLISSKAKAFYNKLFPKEKILVVKNVNKVLDSVFCLFNKISSRLVKMVSKILGDVVDRYVNVPLCAVENIISTIIANIFNFISSSVTNIIQPIKNILGNISILVEDFFTASQTLLSLFSCDENPKCPTVKSWNPITGAQTVKGLDLNNIIDRAKTIESNIKDIGNFEDLNFDLSGLYQDTCNIGPLFCGPPVVEFIGGGGSGASANTIVNSLGQIIGIDLISSGSNYTEAPIVKFVDSCGLGSGATAVSELNSNGEIARVVVTEPGQNYLATYNGTLGGDGRVWSTPDQTIILRNDSKYDQPYNPNETYELNEGDTKIGPFNSNNIMLNEDYPFDGKGRYPVYLKLCDFRILDPGFNYSESDTVIIEPSNGAEMRPTFNEYGALTNLEIISSGNGFESLPNIFIKTETGRNVKILPILCVHSIGNNADAPVPEGVKLLSVVDCVGKI